MPAASWARGAHLGPDAVLGELAHESVPDLKEAEGGAETESEAG